MSLRISRDSPEGEVRGETVRGLEKGVAENVMLSNAVDDVAFVKD